MRRILSGIMVGAFVFGLGAAEIQPVSASSVSDYKDAKQKIEKSKQKMDKTQEKFGQNKNDGQKPPEPPKDENGNPMPPPDRNNGDNSAPPEPPKDENGNPMPPPDRNSNESR